MNLRDIFKLKKTPPEDILKRVGDYLSKRGFNKVEITTIGEDNNLYTYNGSTVKKNNLELPIAPAFNEAMLNRHKFDTAIAENVLDKMGSSGTNIILDAVAADILLSEAKAKLNSNDDTVESGSDRMMYTHPLRELYTFIRKRAMEENVAKGKPPKKP